MRPSPSPRARSREPSADPADLERRVLRHICQSRLTRAAWAEIARGLREYTWRDVEHGLVYAAIQRLASRDPKTLREQLPAQATRMGFPDIDWRIYFDSTEIRATAVDFAEIAALIGKLQSLGPRSPGPGPTRFRG